MVEIYWIVNVHTSLQLLFVVPTNITRVSLHISAKCIQASVSVTSARRKPDV